MSSYLSFYLIPKKSKKYFYTKDDSSSNTEIKISEGLPLLFMSYSRSSDVYQAYYTALNPAYCGLEEKYTDVSYEDSQRIVNEFKSDIEGLEQKLKVSYKILKEGGYNSELWEEIQSSESYLIEQKEVLAELEFISNFIYEIYSDVTDFEKVVINVD